MGTPAVKRKAVNQILGLDAPLELLGEGTAAGVGIGGEEARGRDRAARSGAASAPVRVLFLPDLIQAAIPA